RRDDSQSRVPKWVRRTATAADLFRLGKQVRGWVPRSADAPDMATVEEESLPSVLARPYQSLVSWLPSRGSQANAQVVALMVRDPLRRLPPPRGTLSPLGCGLWATRKWTAGLSSPPGGPPMPQLRRQSGRSWNSGHGA